MSKINWTSIILGAALVVVCFLYWKGCKSSGKAIQEAQDSLNAHVRITDSISKKAVILSQIKDSVIKKNTIDSLSYLRVNDSLKIVINTLKGKFSTTKDSIQLLYGQLKSFYLAGDSASLRAVYVHLSDQLTEANNQLFSIQLARDSLENADGFEINRLNGVVSNLKNQLDSTYQLLTAQIANSKAEEVASQKVLNKQKRAKLWGALEKLGIAIAAFYIGLKF